MDTEGFDFPWFLWAVVGSRPEKQSSSDQGGVGWKLIIENILEWLPGFEPLTSIWGKNALLSANADIFSSIHVAMFLLNLDISKNFDRNDTVADTEVRFTTNLVCDNNRRSGILNIASVFLFLLSSLFSLLLHDLLFLSSSLSSSHITPLVFSYSHIVFPLSPIIFEPQKSTS